MPRNLICDDDDELENDLDEFEEEDTAKVSKSKNKPSKGFLSGIFGKKSSKTKAAPKKRNIELEDNCEVEEPLEGPVAYTKPVEEGNKGIQTKPTKQDISENYSQIQQVQNVFMYMTPSYFSGVQKYYNDTFEDINVLGTSSIVNLTKEFQRRTICNVILLFAFYDEEVGNLYTFLKSIGFEDLDRRLLNVLLVPREDVDISLISEDPVLKNFVSTSEPIVVDKMHPLKGSLLDRVMSGVVQNQPVYVEKKEPVRPKPVKHKEPTIAKIYNIGDMTKFQERVARVKRKTYGPGMKDQLLTAVAGMSENNASTESILEQVPHMKIIQQASKQLDDAIEELSASPFAKRDLEELIETRFLMANLKTAELQSIMSEIIDKVNAKLNVCESTLNDMNLDCVKELNAAKANNEELMKLRKRIKKEIRRKYTDFKLFVQAISNAEVVQANVGTLECNRISELVAAHQNIIPTSQLSTIVAGNKKMNMSVQKCVEDKKTAERRLAQAIEFTNEAFKEFNLLSQVDDLIINNYQNIVEKLEGESIVHRYTDTVFKAIGVNIVAIKDSGIQTIFKLIKGKHDLFIYIGDGNQKISENEYTLADFMEPDWSYDETAVININKYTTAKSINNTKTVDRIIDKLNYVARSFNNIYIIQEVEVDSEELDSKLFLRCVSEVGSLVYFSTLHEEKARTINMIHNAIIRKIPADSIHGIRLVYNAVKKEEREKRAGFLKLCSIRAREVSIPYRKNIEQCDDVFLAKLKTLKQNLK